MRCFTSAALTALLALGSLAAAPGAGQAQTSVDIGFSVGFPPPPLPLYDQPPIPDYGYVWVPGYWAWDPGYGDYYWVPGDWVLPPDYGLLWTPAWWEWNERVFIFHPGYWGRHVGFYGGINYGFGYTGHGYQGGYWRGRDFFYNRAVNNLRNRPIANVFDRPVIGQPPANRASFNGGMGGVFARPTPEEWTAMHEPRFAPPPRPIQRPTQSGPSGGPPVAAPGGGYHPAPQPPMVAPPRPPGPPHPYPYYNPSAHAPGVGTPPPPMGGAAPRTPAGPQAGGGPPPRPPQQPHAPPPPQHSQSTAKPATPH